MPSFWREKLDPTRHRDFMAGAIGGLPRVAERIVNGEKRPADPLVPGWAYFVRVGGFTFEFPFVDAIQEAVD